VNGEYKVIFEPNGHVSIGKLHSIEGHRNLADMQGLPVRAGFEPNRLQILAVGPRIAVYVNGELALFATDPDYDERYKSGPFDLVVCNQSDTPLEARWDNLKIWDISDLAPPSAQPAPTVHPAPAPPPTTAPASSPRAEQARAFAEPLLAARAGRSPDYQDDFSDPGSGWDVGTEYRGGERGYLDGEYFIGVGPSICSDGHLATRPEFSDFVLEIDGRFVSTGKGDWQVYVRSWHDQATGADGGYNVWVETNGKVNISRRDNTLMTNIFEPETPVAKPGLATNNLQIIAKGPQIVALVNGELAAFANDRQPFEKGTVYLTACNHGDTPLQAQWDNLKIWDISSLALP
jgi:hypothetical protein